GLCHRWQPTRHLLDGVPWQNPPTLSCRKPRAAHVHVTSLRPFYFDLLTQIVAKGNELETKRAAKLQMSGCPAQACDCCDTRCASPVVCSTFASWRYGSIATMLV